MEAGWVEAHPAGRHRRVPGSRPDPYDQEDLAEETTRSAFSALRHGGALVADAAGNKACCGPLERHISTVAGSSHASSGARGARGLEGNAAARNADHAEGVATSVTVAPTARTTWVSFVASRRRRGPRRSGGSSRTRSTPSVTRSNPDKGDCKLYADGFTSIVDLAADR